MYIEEQTRIGGGGQSSRFGWSCMSLADLSGPKKFLSMSSQNVCLSEKVEILFLCVLFCHSEILLHSLNVRGADAI